MMGNKDRVFCVQHGKVHIERYEHLLKVVA